MPSTRSWFGILPSESTAPLRIASVTPSATTQNPEARHRPPPPLWRRLAAFLYEGVILFGLVVIGGLLYSPLVGQRHALQGSQGLQLVLFMLIGIYFVWFWRKTGQTLPMRTWHIRLVRRDGQGLSALQAAGRYLLCWLWFIPALWGAQQGHLGSTVSPRCLVGHEAGRRAPCGRRIP